MHQQWRKTAAIILSIKKSLRNELYILFFLFNFSKKKKRERSRATILIWYVRKWGDKLAPTALKEFIKNPNNAEIVYGEVQKANED